MIAFLVTMAIMCWGAGMIVVVSYAEGAPILPRGRRGDDAPSMLVGTIFLVLAVVLGFSCLMVYGAEVQS